METPTLTPWVPWKDRLNIQGSDLPGVYLLGEFSTPPQEPVDPTAAQIVYIGETCSNTLAGRWYQFNRSAFQQKSGHSGGWTFAEKFCGNQVTEPFEWLYVAAHAVAMDEPRLSAHIRCVERWLLWLFVDRHGRYPLCNSK